MLGFVRYGQRGWIDLLTETKEGYVVIDLKGFPGRLVQWPEKAMEYDHQLLAYRKAMEETTGARSMKPASTCPF